MKGPNQASPSPPNERSGSLRRQLRSWAATAREQIDRPRSPRRQALFLGARILVILLVAWGIGRHIAGLADRIDWSLLNLNPGWLSLSAVLYLANLVLLSLFFRLVICDMGGKPEPGMAMAAYMVSQLGKYLPGKAMVVVLRAGILRGRGARASTSAFATFFETPTALGMGTAIALAIFLSPWGEELPHRAKLIAISGALTLVLAIAMSPWVFSLLLRVLSMPFREEGEKAPRVGWRTRILLVPLLLASWLLTGASAVACVDAVAAQPLGPSQWPVVLAGTALAMAAGFVVVVVPGGLGVREWVIMETLAPSLGPEIAVFTAIALRLVWILAELLGSGGAYSLVELRKRRLLPETGESS